MASFEALPNETLLLIMEQSEDPSTLLRLLQASTHCERIFKTFYRSILKKLAANISPKHPYLVCDALQVRCSKGMVAIVFAKLNEPVWYAGDKKHDIWYPGYIGSPIQALKHLIELNDQVQHFADLLENPPVGKTPEYITSAGRAAIEAALWSHEADLNRAWKLRQPKFPMSVIKSPGGEKKLLERHDWRRLLAERLHDYRLMHREASELAKTIQRFLESTREGFYIWRRMTTSEGLIFMRRVWELA